MRWTIGDILVDRIIELEGPNSPPERVFVDLTSDEILSVPWARPNFVTDIGHLKMSFHAFLVRTPAKTMLVDTCIGPGRTMPYAPFNNLAYGFLDNLAKVGVRREEIDIVMCTHMHYDHVGWNTHQEDGRWVPTFPNARHLFSAVEHEATQQMWKDGEPFASQYEDTIVPVIAADLADFIDPDGFQVCQGVSLISTPGHSAGHYCVLLEDEGETGVITGDLMHNPIQCAFPHRHHKADDDKALAVQTRLRFLDRFGNGSVLVLGSHFASPTAGHIIADGDAWQFAPPAGG